jgi:hypothetical protein
MLIIILTILFSFNLSAADEYKCYEGYYIVKDTSDLLNSGFAPFNAPVYNGNTGKMVQWFVKYDTITAKTLNNNFDKKIITTLNNLNKEKEIEDIVYIKIENYPNDEEVKKYIKKGYKPFQLVSHDNRGLFQSFIKYKKEKL